MSLLLNMLSRLVITFLPRSKRLLISWLQSPSAVILEPKTIKSDTVSTVCPPISHKVMGPDAMILVFLMLSFKPTFSLSYFTFIKRLLSSSSLSAIRVVSSAYLRLLIFLLAILIPACTSSSPAFLLMYSAAGSRRETFHSWQRSWRRRLGLRKGGMEPRESPRIFSSTFPQKPECLLYCFVLSPLTLLGAVPHHHLALSVKELTYSSN